MGEYVKYNGIETKIGTLENLYYTTYEKFINALDAGLLKKAEDNSAPLEFAKPDSGFRFRFPFPDEDQIRIGEYDDFERGVPITIEKTILSEIGDSMPSKELCEMLICQQKLIHREIDAKLCLALIFRDPINKESYRVENDADMEAILKQIIRYHVAFEKDPEKKIFYRRMAIRILKGYRMDNTKMTQKQMVSPKLKAFPVKVRPRRR